MYEASWEWLATRISPDLMPVAKAIVEKTKDHFIWDSLTALCRKFDTDYDNLSDKHGKPELRDRDWALFCEAYSLCIEEDALKALALVQSGIWKEIPAEYIREKTWDRLLEMALVEKTENGYRIPSPTVLKYAKRWGCFVWNIQTEPPPVRKPKSTSPKMKLIVSRETAKHCFKYDEGCFVCHMNGNALRYRLTCEEVLVYKAKLIGQGEGLENHQKDVFICEEDITHCHENEPDIEVVRES